MALARIKNLTKLMLLLGAPVAVLALLFSCGVYCGHENRTTVLAFERDWLGMDVTVPGQPVPAKKVEPTVTPPTPAPPTPKVEPPKVEPPKVEPTAEPAEPVPTEPVPVVLTKVEEPLPFPMPEPAPLSGEHRARLEDPVRISVKVLVDPGLAVRRPDWLAYVQRHVAWASQVLEKQIGLGLDLHGIVKMEAPPRSLADVQEHAREGANLLLVFTNEAFMGPVRAPVPADANLDVMLVHASPGSRAGHLRGLLFALGQVLGAQPLAHGSEEARAGSWMGDVLGDDARPIKLDATNRLTMLMHKALRFAPPATPSGAPEPKPPTVLDEDPALPEEENE